MKINTHNSASRGFTIVELMIALAVLSTILVISATVVINLGLLYTKGLNQSNTQNTARNLMNEIAAQLQQGGAVPQVFTSSPPDGRFCLGSKRYSYKLNHKLDGSSDSDHVMWRDTMSNSATCDPLAALFVPNPTPNGTELMSANMRLTELNITDNSNGTYTVKVTIAYGGNPADGADDLVQTSGGRTYCLSGAGRQFCAVSSLVQTVAKRDTN